MLRSECVNQYCLIGSSTRLIALTRENMSTSEEVAADSVPAYVSCHTGSVTDVSRLVKQRQNFRIPSSAPNNEVVRGNGT
jgi:hypothetical protein